MPETKFPLIEYDKRDWEREWSENHTDDEERGEYEIDRSRIIHSSAFRRLQGKTQVFVSGSGDFYRTRLTHSLEAAQIGKGLALRLGAHPDLIEAICLAHDLGHPPFGHSGEDALNRCMRDHGGFEGNAQNLRMVCRLSVKHMETNGLNLTRATLDGILKYKVPFEPGRKKFYYVEDQPLVDWACKYGSSTEKSFECQIMDWADEIAYSIHDLEDGMKSGMITSQRIRTAAHVKDKLDDEQLKWVVDKIRWVEEQPTERKRKAARKTLTSQLIHEFIIAASRTEIEGDKAEGLSVRYRYRMTVNPLQRNRCAALKSVMFRLMVEDARVATLENKAERIVEELFKVFTKTERETGFLFPDDFRDLWEAADEEGKIRVACDYIAGMTDDYAERVYARLFMPRAGSIYNL